MRFRDSASTWDRGARGWASRSNESSFPCTRRNQPIGRGKCMCPKRTCTLRPPCTCRRSAVARRGTSAGVDMRGSSMSTSWRSSPPGGTSCADGTRGEDRRRTRIRAPEPSTGIRWWESPADTASRSRESSRPRCLRRCSSPMSGRHSRSRTDRSGRPTDTPTHHRGSVRGRAGSSPSRARIRRRPPRRLRSGRRECHRRVRPTRRWHRRPTPSRLSSPGRRSPKTRRWHT